MQSKDNAARIHAICYASSDPTVADTMQSLGLAQHCVLPPGACQHVYKSAIVGASGQFTTDQLGLLEECMEGGILYEEVDNVVSITKPALPCLRGV